MDSNYDVETESHDPDEQQTVVATVVQVEVVEDMQSSRFVSISDGDKKNKTWRKSDFITIVSV